MLRILFNQMVDNNNFFDNQDVPFNRVKAALDSIVVINDLINNPNKSSGGLDPVNVSDIISVNMKHLQNEKESGGFTTEELSNIESAILAADTYIKNPGGGGGGSVGNVITFSDCGKGFMFAIDFGGVLPNKVNNGDVYYISVNGYNGCATVIVADKKPIPFRGGDYKNFDLQSDCGTCMKKFGMG